MEPSAYLDAMGITRWVEKGVELPLCHILVDRGASVSDEHPLIRQVLALFPEQDKRVVVSDSLSSIKEVFWDMRSLRLPKVACAICSAPIAVLEQESKAKRELWQHIWESDAYDTDA
ncbi:hypothetical protein GNT65_16360 [Shewanella sp. JBTF-M18]|uniref:DNA polymerase III subunit psi n=1 Tax=Shewanella insulae TaxID=2681496 RepID=A0A6L7I1F6_9GAMM|nr:DNA polymerase III subunit psi [Shewanella insulae]MXR70233.1 hypothetical protein [Shewanella insulae]